MAEVSRPLRDALAGPANAEPLELTSGIVTTVTASGDPYTIELLLPDGTVSPPVPYPGWWVPRVNDVAIVIRQGGGLTVLHAVAPCRTVTTPHRHKTGDIDGYVIPEPPEPPAPPPPPEPPPAIVTRTVQPLDMGSWGGASFNQNQMVQGGPGHWAFWFYGGGIQAARAGGTVIGGSIYVERLGTAHGVGGEANVRLGTHGYTGRPGAAGAIGSVDVVGTLGRGVGRTLPLSAAQIASINAGAVGLGLAAGSPSYTSPDYLRATATAPSGALSLTIQT